MAPGRGAKRSYRSAPERLRAPYYNTDINRFKICTSQSISVSHLFVFLFICVVPLSSHCTNAQSLSARENIDCTYANSTCTTCGNLCLQDQFHPLFPSRCHPLYTVSFFCASIGGSNLLYMVPAWTVCQLGQPVNLMVKCLRSVPIPSNFSRMSYPLLNYKRVPLKGGCIFNSCKKI